MPELDGYETTVAIRKKELETGKHIPIIAVTANATQEDKMNCLKIGMDDYLTKPLISKKLYECLIKHTNETPEVTSNPTFLKVDLF
jgi:CheY-like chemotaxis protein